MTKKIGFIGMGNMALAIASGFISSGMLTGEEVLAYAPHQDKLQKNAERIGFTPKSSLKELVKDSDLILMACKPYQIEEVLREISEELSGKALLSVAAGWDFARYEAILGDRVRIQFIMPNTPAMVKEGVLLFEEKHTLTEEEHELVKNLFASIGTVVELPTRLMGIGGTVTGCGPAFVDLFMEGLADAAVKYGIARPLAYQLVSQLLLGSAKLQLETGDHPGVLKDAVCSPGGTTIRGVEALEHAGLRAAVMDAVNAVMNK